MYIYIMLVIFLRREDKKINNVEIFFLNDYSAMQKINTQNIKIAFYNNIFFYYYYYFHYE